MKNLNNLPAALRTNFHVICVLVSDEQVTFARAAADSAADKHADQAAWVEAFDKAAAEWAATSGCDAALAATTDFVYPGDEAIREARRLVAE